MGLVAPAMKGSYAWREGNSLRRMGGVLGLGDYAKSPDLRAEFVAGWADADRDIMKEVAALMEFGYVWPKDD